MVELDKDTFDEKVINSKELCLVDYFGDTCEPCKALMPHVHELAKQYNHIIILEIINLKIYHSLSYI